MHLAASKLEDPRGIVNNKLYWCAASSHDEANYLCAFLNSPITTEFVRPLMSYGKDERDVHKHVCKLPIPEYDETNPTLQRLARLGQLASDRAESIEVDVERHFSASRRRIRNALAGDKDTAEIDEIVFELLS